MALEIELSSEHHKNPSFFLGKSLQLPRQWNKQLSLLSIEELAITFLYVLGIARHHRPENSGIFPVLLPYPNCQPLHVPLFFPLKSILVAGLDNPCISYDVKYLAHLQLLQFQCLDRFAFECSLGLLVESLGVHRSEQLLKLCPFFSLSFKCTKHHQPQIAQAVPG